MQPEMQAVMKHSELWLADEASRCHQNQSQISPAESQKVKYSLNTDFETWDQVEWICSKEDVLDFFEG